MCKTGTEYKWILPEERPPEKGQKIIALYPMTGGDTWCEKQYYNEHDCQNMLGWMPFPDNVKAPHIPELGNLLFGNSRGIHPINDRKAWDKAFWEFFEDIFDGYGYYLYDKEDPQHTTDRGGYENDIFVINPYYWGDDEDIQDEPNFIYKPTGLEIDWYKYPFRDSYANQDITPTEFREIVKHCADSIKKARKGE